MIVHVLYFTIMSFLLGISVYAVNTPIHRVGGAEDEENGDEEGSTQQP
jgi:hypothetical protein